MKPKQTIRYTILTVVICALHAAKALAQFESGSDGSYGPMNISSNTNLNVPANGVFNCTTITIAGANTQVTFNRNGLNTPIYLLAQSNVVISGYLVIDGGGYGPNGVSSSPGRGGPGGFDGGFGAVQGYSASDGQGPGGGKASGYRGGVFGTVQGANTNVYANTLLAPLIGGSGGAGHTSGGGGGGGGGAIVIASSTSITLNANSNPFGNENIYARGGNGETGGTGSGGGSGGAVRLVAPIVNGTGKISVAGGNAFNSSLGGAGSIRIDTLDRYAWRNLSFDGGAKWSVGAQMYVFTPNNPRLDIVEAAGQAIAVGVTNQVTISLPPGASTNQTVRIQATGFTNDVPVTVAVVPEAGPSSQFNGTISVTSTNSTIGTVNVVIPADSFCNVSVWTH
jgi:hypothetical protein